MRYRPFGDTSTAVSVVSLALTDHPSYRQASDWRTIVYTALENGINTFEIVGRDPAIIDGLAEGLQAVDRHLVFVAQRLGPTATGNNDFDAHNLMATAEATLARTGLGYLDVVVLNEPAERALPQDALLALKGMQEIGRIRHIGVSGEGPALDFYISSGAFNVLVIPYSLQSGWITRNRLRDAVDQNMAIVGYGFMPPSVRTLAGKATTSRNSIWGKAGEDPVAAGGVYGFLHDTYNWTAEEICLAYAMTQPALASIQITSDSAHRIAELAAVCERDMPPGLAPRIEMARFGNLAASHRA